MSTSKPKKNELRAFSIDVYKQSIDFSKKSKTSQLNKKLVENT